MTEYKNSVVSGGELEPLFSLGEIFVSDFLKEGESPKYPPCELALAFDPISTALQLTKQPDLQAMWGSMYWYRSATNEQMVRALKDSAEKTINSIPKSEKREIYIDVAGNDGVLLSHLDPAKFYRINIDPSDYPEAKNNAELVIRDYFTKESFYKSGYRTCRYLSANAVVYDLSMPQVFFQDIYDILEDDGIATIQLSYTPLMVKQLEFGNVVHEHLCYYNLYSIKYLCDKVGLIIKDVQLNNTNGGSIRCYLQKDVAPDNFLSPADKDICKIRIDSLLKWEENNGFHDKQVYLDFYQKILQLKETTANFIKQEKAKGKIIYGYGASTKISSLFQFFGLDNTLIDKISDKQDCKVGRRMIGTNIEIISDEQMRKDHPDYLFIGPWFFRQNFIEREKEYLKRGGVMLFPAPNFELYSLEQ